MQFMFNKINTEIDVLNIDNVRKLSWLFIYETFKIGSYLEKAGR